MMHNICREQLLEIDYLHRGHLVHHEQLKPFFCVDCDQRFATKTALSLHAPKHSQDTPHPCPNCSKRFKWKHGLNNHMIVHANEKRLLCDECGYSTSHLKTLRAHQLSHTGIVFRCPTSGCSYTSRRKENLKIHTETHFNETPFVCEVCGHRFSQNKNLKRHALLHLADKNIHKCPHCEFTSYRTDKLKEHIVRQHTEKPLQLELDECVPSALDDTDAADIVVEKRKRKLYVAVPSQKPMTAKRKPAFILPKSGITVSPSISDSLTIPNKIDSSLVEITTIDHANSAGKSQRHQQSIAVKPAARTRPIFILPKRIANSIEFEKS